MSVPSINMLAFVRRLKSIRSDIENHRKDMDDVLYEFDSLIQTYDMQPPGLLHIDSVPGSTAAIPDCRSPSDRSSEEERYIIERVPNPGPHPDPYPCPTDLVSPLVIDLDDSDDSPDLRSSPVCIPSIPPPLPLRRSLTHGASGKKLTGYVMRRD